MRSKRFLQLEKMIKTTPNDPFLLYALALEYKSQNEFTAAREQFRQLAESHSDYLPTYFQLGELLFEEGKFQEAQKYVKEGIELAKQQQNNKTAGELSMLLEEIEDMLD